MLYAVGTLTLDTRPFSADEVERTSSSAFGVKPVMGRLAQREYMGEGDDRLTLSGRLLPFKTGGLTGLELAHQLRAGGQRLPVMRGDGRMLGWHVIEEITESHSELMADGVGFVVRHSLRLTKVAPAGTAADIVGAMISVFAELGR